MNVFLAGEGSYAAAVHERLQRVPGVDIVGVAVKPDKTDPLNVAVAQSPYASTLDIAHLRVPTSTRYLFDRLDVDLLVLANVQIILPLSVVDAPRHGSLCFHPSLLPRHRGKDSVRDTIAAGDVESGVTIFRPDAGADTGPIVEQIACAVPPGVSAGRLYYGTLVPLGVDAMLDAIKAVRDGRAVYTPQPEPAYEDAAD